MGSHELYSRHIENYYRTIQGYSLKKISVGGTLFTFDGDVEVKKIALAAGDNIRKIPL